MVKWLTKEYLENVLNYRPFGSPTMHISKSGQITLSKIFFDKFGAPTQINIGIEGDEIIIVKHDEGAIRMNYTKQNCYLNNSKAVRTFLKNNGFTSNKFRGKYDEQNNCFILKEVN